MVSDSDPTADGDSNEFKQRFRSVFSKWKRGSHGPMQVRNGAEILVLYSLLRLPDTCAL